MQELFFKSDMTLDEASKTVFSALGINNFMEGDSSFSPKGYYYKGIILGIVIKIDVNNYDYEDYYNYMMSIKADVGTKLSDDNALLGVAEIIASLISMKLGIEVALEVELRRSDHFSLKVFKYDGDKVIANLKEL